MDEDKMPQCIKQLEQKQTTVLKYVQISELSLTFVKQHDFLHIRFSTTHLIELFQKTLLHERQGNYLQRSNLILSFIKYSFN